MRITRFTTDHLRVPLGKPGRVSLTEPKVATPDAAELLLVHLETDAGVSGLGFTYAIGPGAAAVRSLIDTAVSQVLVGEDPWDTDRHLARAEARFRPVGFAGLAARAYSAADIALWDIKAKAVGVPLFKLLGAARPAAPVFASDLATLGRTAADVVKAARPLLKHGPVSVRVEIGSGDIQADADRVREISEGLGEDASVGVAAGGRFDLGTAMALAHFFEDQGIDLFEEPIPAADAAGYAKLAGMMEVPLAAGAFLDSRDDLFRLIRAGDVRTVRPDPARLGGITPVLKVAAVAEAFHVAVSPVRLPEVGVHLACGLGVIPVVDSVGWFADVFAGGPTAAGGKLEPPAEPGLGLAVNEANAAKWRVP